MYILIVEDDEPTAIAIEHALNSILKIETKSVNEPLKAIKTMNELSPTLILLDYLLSKDTADSFLDYCESLNSIPKIIVMSACARSSKAVQHRKIDQFISKPFELDFFINSVTKHLNV